MLMERRVKTTKYFLRLHSETALQLLQLLRLKWFKDKDSRLVLQANFPIMVKGKLGEAS